jgi:hypothetical protein
MDNASEARSVRLTPRFDGTPKAFQVWWIRFMAFATVGKFIKALKNDTNMPTTMNRNAIAISNLTLAFSTEAMMGLVYKAMTTSFPSGLAYMVVEALFKKFRPQDTITRVELRQMLNSIKMKKGSDPASLFEQISSVENRFNIGTRGRIDQDDLIAVVLDAAPQEYQALLTGEQRRRATLLTIEDLEMVMNQYWRQTNKEREQNDEESEVTLAIFEGFCYNCKEKGHKSPQCPNKKEQLQQEVWRSQV